MENKVYVCSECGCVFEGKNVIANLTDRLGKDSFKNLLQNPFKHISEIISERACPECGSNQVMEANDKAEIELPEYMTSGWDSSLLNEDNDIDEQSADSSEEKSSVKDFVKKSLGFFNGKIDDFKEKYNLSDLMKKIKAIANKAGASTVYHVLLLYYTLADDKVPTDKKIIIMAALGYFIAPLDFVPDFIPLGLIDDSTVLLYAINQILPYITDDIKAKAYAKLRDWFGETEIVSIKSDLLPNITSINDDVEIETEEVKDCKIETIERSEITENEEQFTDTGNCKKESKLKSNNMEIVAPYKELNAYVAEKFNQPIELSYLSEDEVKVIYTKRVVIKDVSVSVRIKFEEVKADSLLLAYNVALGLDSVISGAISFLTKKFPELAAGIHPEDGHRIRINLSEIEKAKALVENVALRAITPCDDSLRIEFSLKAAK